MSVVKAEYWDMQAEKFAPDPVKFLAFEPIEISQEDNLPQEQWAHLII
jgi:hypothetical protein